MKQPSFLYESFDIKSLVLLNSSAKEGSVWMTHSFLKTAFSVPRPLAGEGGVRGF
jgi:hypothetical protein